jgi:hypothetical protein
MGNIEKKTYLSCSVQVNWQKEKNPEYAEYLLFVPARE